MKKLRIQNILVPIDFSDPSIGAMATAKKLARDFGARLHLLHVFDAIYPTGFIAPTPRIGGEIVATMLDEQKKHAHSRLREIAARFHVPVTDTRMVTGAPAFDGICQAVRDLGVDLVVMSTHGRTGIRRVVLGSTAERVVQHSPAPVLVVRKGRGRVKKILVPVDFSGCSLQALNYAIDFARATDARITLLHVVYLGYANTADGYAMYDMREVLKATRKDAIRQMREFIAAAKFEGVEFETAVTVGLPTDEICAFASRNDIDLIVTATHGRTGFEHVLIGSIAENVVRHADKPVLVVPSHPAVRSKPLTPQRRQARIIRGVRGRRTARPAAMPATRPQHGALLRPIPERRQINKFRESHLRP